LDEKKIQWIGKASPPGEPISCAIHAVTIGYALNAISASPPASGSARSEAGRLRRRAAIAAPAKRRDQAADYN